MRYTSKYKVDIKCPFYDHEYIQTINCEGMGTAVSNVMRFNNEAEKDMFIEHHCLREFPENCPLYRILMEKYD